MPALRIQIPQVLFDLIVAADFLDIKSLLDLTCAQVLATLPPIESCKFIFDRVPALIKALESAVESAAVEDQLAVENQVAVERAQHKWVSAALGQLGQLAAPAAPALAKSRRAAAPAAERSC